MDLDGGLLDGGSFEDGGAGRPVPDGPFLPEEGRLVWDGPDLSGLTPSEAGPFAQNPAWQFHALGPVRLEGGKTGPIVLELGPDVTGFQLVARADDGRTVIPTSIEDARGSVWVTDEIDDPQSGNVIRSMGFPGQQASAGRVLAKQTVGSWSFPNTDQLTFEPGSWTVEVGVYDVGSAEEEYPVAAAEGAVSVAVVISEAREEPELDLVVHVASADITAADAPENPTLGPAMETFFGVLEAAGIPAGEVIYLDVDDAALDVVTLGEQCQGGELDTLMKTTGDLDPEVAEGRLHLFFVDGFECTLNGLEFGENIGGLAAGLPSSGPLVGTRESGVAVSLGFADDDSAKLASVTAHEVGHALGLFHSKERPRFDATDVFDLISDTPEEDPLVEDNLMFFAALSSLELTEGQKAILAKSTLVAR